MPQDCPRCGKGCRDLSDLARHLARKTPCAPILEPADLPAAAQADPALGQKQCRFCKRVFASYTSMRRHVRGACGIAPNPRNGAAGMEVLYAHTLRAQAAAIVELQQQNAEMQAEMQELVQRLTPLTVEVRDQARVAVDARRTTNHITINVFGQETTAHVTPAQIRAVLDEAARAADPPGAAVLRAATLVYSDPEHPENLTCYLPSRRGDEALVHTGAGWEVRPAALVLPPMARRSVDTLFDRQPYEAAEEYAPLMRELAQNERRYATGEALRPILVRNKELLARALAGRVAAAAAVAAPVAAEKTAAVA